jgi:hypothetical protein
MQSAPADWRRTLSGKLCERLLFEGGEVKFHKALARGAIKACLHRGTHVGVYSRVERGAPSAAYSWECMVTNKDEKLDVRPIPRISGYGGC